jgi:PAS domain S-box-containing protein
LGEVDQPQTEELEALRRALGNMAALSSLTAMWVKADEERIATDLADALMRVLDLEGVRVAFARDAGETVEISRLPNGGGSSLPDLLQAAFPEPGAGEARDLASDTGLRGFCAAIGVSGAGRLDAVSRRRSFPTQAEHLALTMAANQVAVAWQRARAERTLRAQTEALARDWRAADVLNRQLGSERESLRESEAQFRLLVQGVTDYAIYMLTPDGHVRTWNAGAQRIKGYAPEEIIGRHFSTFYASEDRAAGRPQIGLRTAAAVGRFESEGWRVRKDGTRFWASVVIDAVHDDDGQLIGFAKITRDITERRAAQEQLEKAREALFQSHKMEALGQLTGGVAHDFNNLLMAVLGSLELMKKHVTELPRLARLVDNAIQGAQRGASLTQRMLAFARQQELKQEAVQVPQLIRGMLDLIERTIGGGVRIETELNDDLPPIATDPNQLESALLNLSVNARDAMPDGGTITISASEETIDEDRTDETLIPGRYLRICVADTGVGMAPETISRATDPFFTTKEVGKGTGLGLSMVKGLVEQSGGKLRIHSEVGKGTGIELWFPTTCEEAHPARPSSPVERTGIGQRTILVVDDDSLVLLNTAMMLEDLGHTVLQAGSGAEALTLLEGAAGIDLVITDQIMPKMTGIQLTEVIHSRWPDIRVILATGYAELPDEVPRVTRLAKPFMQTDLVQALGSAMARAPSD